MQINSLELSAPETTSFPQSAQVLRKWCSPETILVITNLLDEDALLFHIVRQARQGAAKVILIQAAHHRSPLSFGRSRNPRQVRQSLSYRFAQLVLARMARKLRWAGLECEPILNRAFFFYEIDALVRSRHVDRILVTAQGGQSGVDASWAIFTEHLLRSIEVPVCIIGTQAATNFGGRQRSGRVLLALSLKSDSELALAFASRFAQEHHLRLTVVHVFAELEVTSGHHQSPREVASRLPLARLREAELFCPLEISVFEGDTASEILKYQAVTDQDFIILRSAGSVRSSRSDAGSIAQKIVREAHCPVIILSQPATACAHERDSVAPKVKPPAAINSLPSEAQSERTEDYA